MKYQFFCNCVSWPERAEKGGGLSDMIQDAIDITRATFLKHVHRDHLRELEDACGYDDHPSKGLTMAGDYHVSYHRSKLHGRRVYYFRWSGIEYVFTPDGKGRRKST
jgi:hypothetical protein